VVGSCEYGDEPSGSSATVLVAQPRVSSLLFSMSAERL
jgi:hypothetical protein